LGKANFRQLFTNNARQENVYKPGESFPSATQLQLLDGQSALLCFISLSCASCIDLIPRIGSALQHFNGSTILFIDGTEEERREFVEYFHYDFQIEPLFSEDRMNFKVDTTPFVYLLDGKQTVIWSGIIYNEGDLQEALETCAI